MLGSNKSTYILSDICKLLRDVNVPKPRKIFAQCIPIAQAVIPVLKSLKNLLILPRARYVVVSAIMFLMPWTTSTKINLLNQQASFLRQIRKFQN